MAQRIALSLVLFVLAGLCEVGGGYLMWQWLREHRSVLLGVVGAGVLVLYGVIPTYQAAHFGRVYAAYGGVFVVLSTLWGWLIDRHAPDLWDVVGAMICLVGVALIMWMPRGGHAG